MGKDARRCGCFKRWLISRLCERTTWLGIIGVLTSFAILPFDEQVSGYIATILTSIGGLIAILWDEDAAGKRARRRMVDGGDENVEYEEEPDEETNEEPEGEAEDETEGGADDESAEPDEAGGEDAVDIDAECEGGAELQAALESAAEPVETAEPEDESDGGDIDAECEGEAELQAALEAAPEPVESPDIDAECEGAAEMQAALEAAAEDVEPQQAPATPPAPKGGAAVEGNDY